MNRILTTSASERIEDISFSRVSTGDKVIVRNPNPSWGLPYRYEVEAVDEDAIRIDGAWYREADGWTVHIVITPETVEVKEPLPAHWDRALGGAGYGGKYQIMVRSLSDAGTMITYNQVNYHAWKDGAQKMYALAGHIQWESFSRAMYRIGVDNLDAIMEPFHKLGLEAIKGRTFYEMGDDKDALEIEISMALLEFSSEKLFRKVYNVPIDEQKRIWILSLASYYSTDGKPISHDDLMLVIDSLGEGLYLEYALRHMPLKEMKSLAIQIRDNDIDTELVRGLLQPKLPDNIDWL